MASESPASQFAMALLSEFVGRGVRDVVLSPGSRSQALALAAAEFERAGLIRLRVRIDERVAGFLALGIAVETGSPVLVVTTSGTAVANLHPAVLEAHHSGVPLILLTADRPDESRGIGANQTTEQVGIFGASVAFVRDVASPSESRFDPDYPGELADEAISAAIGHSSAPGPVQLNLAFREPLSGPVRAATAATAATGATGATAVEARLVVRVRPGPPVELRPSPNTVVIAGHGAGESAEATARMLGAPLLAEVSSGARFGPNLVVAYRELLNQDEFGGRIERAIVFGHPTLSREVPALIQRDDVEAIVVRSGAAEDYNPGHRVAQFADTIVVVGEDGSPDARAWLGRWVAASRRLLETDDHTSQADAHTDDKKAVAEFTRAQLAVFRQPVTRRMLAEAVWRVTWPHDRLVLAASRLIREVDRVVPGKKIPVHANRGLSGIDGTIATALGIALASQGRQDRSAAGVTRVLLGDLALLYDAGALLFGVGETRPRLQVIVGNDGGGTIFDGLEVAATARRDALDRVLYTPQTADLASLATAYGWDYLPADNRGELDQALTSSANPTLIEVHLPRA